MMKWKRMTAFGMVAAMTVVAFAGCGKTSSSESPAMADDQETTKIIVGASITPHSEILKQAQPILAEEGIDLEIVQIEDVVTPNTGVVEGTLDANFFQHQPYLDDFNSENGTDLVSLGAVHYEPFGIYAGKTADLAALPDGALVAVPNNVTNEARALLLLQQEGLLTLDENAGVLASVNDIVDNPRNIQFSEIDPSQLVRALPDVDLAVINGNYALEGGLSAADALATESKDGLAAQTYKNILVTRQENADNEALLRLAEVLQSEEIQNYITETYQGSVIPVQ